MKIKFVRWLGAFGSGSDLDTAAAWEISQGDRQVAAEPLFQGRSLIDKWGAKIGLAVNHNRSRLAGAWLSDAWTQPNAIDGTLRPKYKPRHRQGRRFKDVDRFLKAWNAEHRCYHGEAVFDNVHYCAVVVKPSATPRGVRRANRLAERLGLPLITIGGKSL